MPAVVLNLRPPYYVVVFTSLRTPTAEGYAHAANRMLELARVQPGFLGADSARGSDGLGITCSYWTDEQAIAAWRRQGEHLQTQAQGRAQWYEEYSIHVARVERAYSWQAAPE